MIIYLINYFLIFVLYFFTKHIKHGKKIFLFLTFFIMWCIVVLRWNIGVDYQNYNRIYSQVITSNLFEAFQIIEPGYAILIYFSNILFPNNVWFMHFIVGTITMIFFYLAIKKISPSYFLSVYIFVSINFFYSMMNQERQFLALSIVAYSLYYLINKKDKLKFIILILIAMTFHYSSIVCLLLLLPNYISKFKYKKILFSICILFLFIIILNLEKILYGTSYGRYFNSYYDNQLQISVILNTFVRLFISIPIYYFYRKYKMKFKKCEVLFHMFFFMMFFQICSLASSVFGRLTTYFFAAIIFIIPIIIDNIKFKMNKKVINKIIIFIIVLLFIPYHFIYFQIQSESMGVNQYISIFETK